MQEGARQRGVNSHQKESHSPKSKAVGEKSWSPVISHEPQLSNYDAVQSERRLTLLLPCHVEFQLAALVPENTCATCGHAGRRCCLCRGAFRTHHLLPTLTLTFHQILTSKFTQILRAPSFLRDLPSTARRYPNDRRNNTHGDGIRDMSK